MDATVIKVPEGTLREARTAAEGGVEERDSVKACIRTSPGLDRVCRLRGAPNPVAETKDGQQARNARRD